MKLHNTLTRTVEEFTPKENTVTLYTCGLTVYAHPHIGNWSYFIFCDILHRTLLGAGYSVNRTQNITDVGHLVSDDDDGEDKLEKGARQEGLSAWDVAAKYTKIAEKEAVALQLLPPTSMIPATSCIDAQIECIVSLEQKGYTYTTKDGVYFDTSKVSDYGKLARLDKTGLAAGARVDVAGKKHITDFALWKFNTTGKKRDMEWDSPFGRGFPGWHIECSAIALQTLGETIDIHTGGIDHIPVHHTNEIAQTESLTGKPFARFWAHSNHIKVNNTKISKSLGNGYLLSDITRGGYSLMAFKLMVLSKHYRTEGNFTFEILESFENRLKKWRKAVDTRWQPDILNQVQDSQDEPYRADMFAEKLDALLQDDLNTPGALAYIDAFFDEVEKGSICAMCVDSNVSLIDQSLGLDLGVRSADITDQQKNILRERQSARENKDWGKSDTLRTTLESMGIGVKDLPQTQQWFRLK